MSVTAFAWLGIAAGKIVLDAVALTWWFYGWRWALGVFVLGPLLMLGCACAWLVFLFFFDPREPPCRRCGHRAPLQLWGPKYRRPWCESCLDEIKKTHPAIEEVSRL